MNNHTGLDEPKTERYSRDDDLRGPKEEARNLYEENQGSI